MWYTDAMRFFFYLIAIFMMVDGVHARMISPILPAVEYIDFETTTNVALEVWRPHVNHLALEMQGLTTPSNNIEVAFGVDGKWRI